MTLTDAISDVTAEYVRASEKFGPFASAHEGFAVLMEEVDELWDEVKANRGYDRSAEEEAVQVAAMAIRYLVDVSYRERTKE